jgi:hypothetical protein
MDFYKIDPRPWKRPNDTTRKKILKKELKWGIYKACKANF